MHNPKVAGSNPAPATTSPTLWSMPSPRPRLAQSRHPALCPQRHRHSGCREGLHRRRHIIPLWYLPRSCRRHGGPQAPSQRTSASMSSPSPPIPKSPCTSRSSRVSPSSAPGPAPRKWAGSATGSISTGSPTAQFSRSACFRAIAPKTTTYPHSYPDEQRPSPGLRHPQTRQAPRL